MPWEPWLKLLESKSLFSKWVFQKASQKTLAWLTHWRHSAGLTTKTYHRTRPPQWLQWAHQRGWMYQLQSGPAVWRHRCHPGREGALNELCGWYCYSKILKFSHLIFKTMCETNKTQISLIYTGVMFNSQVQFNLIKNLILKYNFYIYIIWSFIVYRMKAIFSQFIF